MRNYVKLLTELIAVIPKDSLADQNVALLHRELNELIQRQVSIFYGLPELGYTDIRSWEILNDVVRSSFYEITGVNPGTENPEQAMAKIIQSKASLAWLERFRVIFSDQEAMAQFEKTLPEPVEQMFACDSFVQHVKTGGIYLIKHGPARVRIEATGEPGYAYTSVREDGTEDHRTPLWIRPQLEMEDGRFVLKARVQKEEPIPANVVRLRASQFPGAMVLVAITNMKIDEDGRRVRVRVSMFEDDAPRILLRYILTLTTARSVEHIDVWTDNGLPVTLLMKKDGKWFATQSGFVLDTMKLLDMETVS